MRCRRSWGSKARSSTRGRCGASSSPHRAGRSEGVAAAQAPRRYLSPPCQPVPRRSPPEAATSRMPRSFKAGSVWHPSCSFLRPDACGMARSDRGGGHHTRRMLERAVRGLPKRPGHPSISVTCATSAPPVGAATAAAPCATRTAASRSTAPRETTSASPTSCATWRIRPGSTTSTTAACRRASRARRAARPRPRRPATSRA